MEDKEQSKMDLELFKVYAQKNSLRGPKDLKTANIKPKGSKRRLNQVKIICQDKEIGHGKVMCKNHNSSVIS